MRHSPRKAGRRAFTYDATSNQVTRWGHPGLGAYAGYQTEKAGRDRAGHNRHRAEHGPAGGGGCSLQYSLAVQWRKPSGWGLQKPDLHCRADGEPQSSSATPPARTSTSALCQSSIYFYSDPSSAQTTHLRARSAGESELAGHGSPAGRKGCMGDGAMRLAKENQRK